MIVAKLRAAGCVFAEDEAALLMSSATSPAELDAMVSQRVAGMPLEHVLGWASFCGLRIFVSPGVFVPRRRTEYLVAEALQVTRPGATVVDLCCGSGAVGAAVQAFADDATLFAADIDPVAVRCARRNVSQVYEGDLYAALPQGLRVDVLVCNAPYVPTSAIPLMPPEARDHEPRVALDGGADGLDVLRRVAADAREWLAPGGHLLVETSARQAAASVAIFESNGLVTRVTSAVVIGHFKA